MLFTSTYIHSLDAKRRLAIPAQWRARLDPTVHGARIMVSPGSGGRLCLWTEKEFELQAEPFRSGLVNDAAAARRATILFSNSDALEVDTAGRVRIPDRLLDLFKLEDKVVLLGVGGRQPHRTRQRVAVPGTDAGGHHGHAVSASRALQPEQTHQDGALGAWIAPIKGTGKVS
ncbi:MAG: Transcriptional regulator MraZ [Planctomycetota bacterium]